VNPARGICFPVPFLDHFCCCVEFLDRIPLGASTAAVANAATGKPHFFLDVLSNDVLLSSFDGFHHALKVPNTQFTKLVDHMTKHI
jgi:hypothetical protein